MYEKCLLLKIFWTSKFFYVLRIKLLELATVNPFFFQGQNILSKKFTTCMNTETTNFLNQICKYFSPLCSPAALLSTARRPSAQNFSILAFK